MNDATAHYLTADIDPMFIRASRDSLIAHVRGPRVLNVGVGYGVWDERLASLAGAEVIGVDWDAELVRTFQSRHPSIRYVQSDVFAYRPPGPFDTICASHFLEHVDDPVRLLRLFAGWLAPNGTILIVVPNAGSMHRRIGREMGLLREVTDLNEGDHKLGHKRVYTEALLREHIAASGLHARQLRGVTFKALSNAQLAAMPRNYVEACIAMAGEDLAGMACQLAAVLTVTAQ